MIYPLSHSKILPAAFIAGVLIFANQPAFSAELSDLNRKVAAKVLLDKVVKFYRTAETYHDTGTAYTINQYGDKDLKQTFKTTYTRQNGIDMKWTEESLKSKYKVSYKLWGDEKCLQTYFIQNGEKSGHGCTPIKHYHSLGYIKHTQNLAPLLIFGKNKLKDFYNTSNLSVEEVKDKDNNKRYAVITKYKGKVQQRMLVHPEQFYITRYENNISNVVIDYDFVAYTSSGLDTAEPFEHPRWKLTGNDVLDNGAIAFYREEFHDAMRYLQPLIKEKNPHALFFKAQMLWMGKGVNKDIDKAYSMMYMAAIQNHAEAQAIYSEYILWGYAYKMGSIRNQFTPQELADEVMKWQHKAAENCHTKTLDVLIHGYGRGADGMKEDRAQEKYWWRKKSECNNVAATDAG